MRRFNALLPVAMALLAGTTHTLPALAATFIVKTATDPAVANPANCTDHTSACSLRDALAAADAVPGPDTILVAASGDIRLRRPLEAQTTVEIIGNFGSVLGPQQGYSVVLLPDKFDDDGNGEFEDVTVLMPDYYSANGSNGALLTLGGPDRSYSKLMARENPTTFTSAV